MNNQFTRKMRNKKMKLNELCFKVVTANPKHNKQIVELLFNKATSEINECYENAENTERGWYLKEDKLTCPFCESDDINVDFTTRYPNNKLQFYAQVECRNCGACGPKFFTACDNPKLAKEKAIEEWKSICNI